MKTLQSLCPGSLSVHFCSLKLVAFWKLYWLWNCWSSLVRFCMSATVKNVGIDPSPEGLSKMLNLKNTVSSAEWILWSTARSSKIKASEQKSEMHIIQICLSFHLKYKPYIYLSWGDLQRFSAYKSHRHASLWVVPVAFELRMLNAILYICSFGILVPFRISGGGVCTSAGLQNAF